MIVMNNYFFLSFRLINNLLVSKIM